jgi:adenylate kinase family enzyme
MRRVSVVGCPGTGKSTLGRQLAGVLGVPFVELDAIFHLPGWQDLPPDEFRAQVGDATAGDGWVVDGNYRTVRDLVWARADTVVFIDLPKALTMQRLVFRTIRRAVTREVLWNGNREPLANFYRLDPSVNIIVWGWQRHGVYRDRYQAAARDPANAHLTFVRLRSPRDVDAFLARTRDSQRALRDRS